MLPMARASSIPILMYHKVGAPILSDADRFLNVPVERFRTHMRLLQRLRYKGITFRQSVDALGGTSNATRRSVCITFDDGFECVRTQAARVLREMGWPATVFVPSAWMGRTIAWGEGADGTPERVMDAVELRALRDEGWEIAGHTKTHADLSALSDDEALAEIAGGAAELAEALGAPVTTFCYPKGRMNDRTPHLVRRAGLSGACTTVSGVARSDADRYLLPRVKPASRDSAALLLYRMFVRPYLP